MNSAALRRFSLAASLVSPLKSLVQSYSLSDRDSARGDLGSAAVAASGPG